MLLGRFQARAGVLAVSSEGRSWSPPLPWSPPCRASGSLDIAVVLSREGTAVGVVWAKFSLGLTGFTRWPHSLGSVQLMDLRCTHLLDSSELSTTGECGQTRSRGTSRCARAVWTDRSAVLLRETRTSALDRCEGRGIRALLCPSEHCHGTAWAHPQKVGRCCARSAL